MASIYFDCPFCSYGKKVPEKYFGKKIKCPRCLATLTLGMPQPTDLVALPLPEGHESPVEQQAIEIETSELQLECPFCFKFVEPEDSECGHCKKSLKKECPFCMELIDASELECFHCKRELTQKMEEDTSEEKINLLSPNNIYYLGMTALICGIGLITGPMAIITGLSGSKHCTNEKDKALVRQGIAMGSVGAFASLVLIAMIL